MPRLTENQTPYPSYIEIDTDLLLLAARGGTPEQEDAWKRMEEMTREEIRLLRRALYRLESWLDNAPALKCGAD